MPEPALVVLGVLGGDPARNREAAEVFGASFGGVDAWGETVAFDQTDYYEAEMGPGLERSFCSFGMLLPPERLVGLKAAAREIEEQFAQGGKRTVNLDPGTLDHAKVVLVSGKHAAHKLYLGEGVYADVLLFFSAGAFAPLPWTFPDLRTGPHVAFFTEARSRYKVLLRKGRGP